MQQELIEMLEKVVDHVVFCNGHDQRFSSTSYGVNILKEADVLIEKAKNNAPAHALAITGEADVWHEGSKSFYRATLLHKLTPEEVFSEPPELDAYTQPAQEVVLTGCNCRWDGSEQVQWCELHLAHKDAIHEWAERAKTAEAKLDRLSSNQEAGLTEAERVRCLIASGCIGTVKMTYDSGPYEITRTSINASRLIDAIIAALRAKENKL